MAVMTGSATGAFSLSLMLWYVTVFSVQFAAVMLIDDLDTGVKAWQWKGETVCADESLALGPGSEGGEGRSWTEAETGCE